MLSNQKSRLIFDILQNKATGGPGIANIYINSDCPLKCEYCWFHSSYNKRQIKSIVIPFSSIKKNLLELKALGTKYLVLSSHGEPWLHPEICDIINFIRKNGFYLRITTNLTFNDPGLKTVFAKVNFLAVTLSAPDNELYLKIHSPGNSKSFQHVISNLKLYSALYRKKSSPFVEVRYIITKNNYRHLAGIVRLCEQLKIPQIRFRILDTTLDTKSLMLNCEEICTLREIIKELTGKTEKVKTNLSSLLDSLNDKGAINFTLNRCFIGWLRISLELNGDIGFCCQNDQLIIGNWQSQSIKDCWFGKKADTFRSETMNNFNINKKFWHACKFCFLEKDNQYFDSLFKRIKSKNV